MHADTDTGADVTARALAAVEATFAAAQEARGTHAAALRMLSDATTDLIEAEKRYAVAVALATRAAEATP